MRISRCVAVVFATAAALLMAAGERRQNQEDTSSKRNVAAEMTPASPTRQDDTGEPPQQPSPPSRTAAQVALVPVLLPLSGDADQQVMAMAARALKEMTLDDRRGIVIFEFRARDGKSIGATSFERALSLARFVASGEFNRVRTVAYVPISLTGHAVLPVLACEEIVIAPDVEFGAAGRDEQTIDATMVAAYRELAQRRRTIPEPVVLGMLDPKLTVVELQLVGGGMRFAVGDDAAAARREGEVWKESTLVGAGDLALITGQAMRTKYGFASHLASDRRQLAEALQVTPAALQENAVVRQAWQAIRIDLRGRITARIVDDVIFAIRDAERRESANLICLHINSPGGSASQAFRLAQVLTGLDAQKIRTLAFVEQEARSVAALIALAADESYARPDSLLGGPGERAFDARELEAMRQPVEELAAVRNRDWSLLMGLVDPRLNVFRCRQQGTGTVRYLCEEERAKLEDPPQWQPENPVALSEGIAGREAQEYGLLMDVVDSPATVLARFNLDHEIAAARRSSVVHAIEGLATQAWFARTLLFIAFFALISEASAPGIGVAGFVSGLCFLLFFWSQFLNGTAGWLEVTLFLGGLICVALELFVLPGFGVFGVGGGVMVLASIVLASQTFIFPANAYQFAQLPKSFTTMVVACGGVLSAIWLMRRYLAESWLFRKLILSPPSDELDLDQAESVVDWNHLSGKRGVTTTQLTPSGKAAFGDDVVNVISDGLPVPKGTSVRVVEVWGNHVLVEPLEEG